jgi:5-formyltetrahydrofolate cyclo-ligase
MDKSKDSIRKAILEARSKISDQEIVLKSSKIADKLYQLEKFKSSKLIMCYVDFRKEVITSGIMSKCLADGKRVTVPLVTCCIGENRQMCASEVKNLECDLEMGFYGIHEPKKEKVRIINPMDIDLCIIPGVAFDINKNRIGYGAGYYDRFLKGVRKECFKVGIAFEEQILQDIPASENDIALDLIITDKRII